MDRLLSRREVADLLRVPVPTLEHWAFKGTGPRYFRVGRHVRYRLEDVQEWLEQHAAGGGSRDSA